MNSSLGSSNDPLAVRLEVCRVLHLGDLGQAHQIIAANAKKGAEPLIQKGLNAANLIKLGYDVSGMRRLGYADAALRRLGYTIPGGAEPASAGAHHTPPSDAPIRQHAAPGEEDETAATELRRLVKSGRRATELHELGFTIHHCKRAGYTALELSQLGFKIEEMVGICSLAELRRADFKPNELRRFFNGTEMLRAGYTAAEMRTAGFGIRELLNFGYNENHVRIAGYSNAELLREGLTKTTRIIQ